MTKEDEIKNLDNFIELANKWLKLNSLKLESTEKSHQYEETRDLLSLQWGPVEEIFKSLEIKFIGDLTPQRTRGIKATQGNFFTDGFIGDNFFSDQVMNLEKVKALALAAKGKIKNGEVIPKNVLPNLNLVISILNSFPDVVSKLTHRRKSKNAFMFSDEYDVQDMVYVMLRGSFPTLQAENPNQKTGITSSISDFTIEDLGLFIEVKFVEDKKKVKNVQEECKQDMVSYSKQPNCRKIIFFIYDPNKYIDNEYAFKNGLGTKIGDEDKEVDIQTLVIR